MTNGPSSCQNVFKKLFEMPSGPGQVSFASLRVSANSSLVINLVTSFERLGHVLVSLRDSLTHSGIGSRTL